jgi:hypothetical protein
MDSLTVQRLVFAWMRRKRWESQLLGREIAALFTPASPTGSGRSPSTGRSSPPGRTINRISGGEMLAMMGVTF